MHGLFGYLARMYPPHSDVFTTANLALRAYDRLQADLERRQDDQLAPYSDVMGDLFVLSLHCHTLAQALKGGELVSLQGQFDHVVDQVTENMRRTYRLTPPDEEV